MRISVFGMGYVGCVTAACLARQGHRIVGVDVQEQKVGAINRAETPIIEPGLGVLVQQARNLGTLRATQNCGEAIAETELSVVSVGTPPTVSGSLDLTHVRIVSRQIAEAIRAKQQSHLLVFRSTMLPGSTEQLIQENLSDLVSGGKLEVFYYPEFLREGSAVDDFENPQLTVVGTQDGRRPSSALMKELFGASATLVNWRTAEMVKYACNAFHATKAAFANEIGRLAKRLGVDGRAVMSILCEDTKLNISSAYLRPGNPFGGSCLPKDVQALTSHGQQHGLNLPLLASLLPSNEQHLQSLLSLIMDSGQQEVAILGLSFKSNTDDLRESAMVQVAQNLLARGLTVRIFDPALNIAALVGSNRRIIDTKMPHLASLLHSSLASALGKQGLVLAAQQCATLEQLQKHLTPQHQILDINGWPELKNLPSKYRGFCW